MKGVKRSAWLRMGAAFLLGAVFLGALAAVIYRQEDYRKGAEDYVEAREIAGLAEPEPLPVASSQLEETTTSDLSSPWADIDLDALQAVNEDVLGWITIPGTELSYPLVQGADNDYYLDHTWNHERAAVGSIFLECSVSPDFTDYNSLIYGHRMHNGSMFGVLRNYLKTDFWRQAPSVYIITHEGAARYDIFAAYQAPVSLPVFTPGQTVATDRQFILSYALSHSAFDSGITPDLDDRMLTLVTCTGVGYSSRLIVQATYVGIEQ